jgi:hypothetical protein
LKPVRPVTNTNRKTAVKDFRRFTTERCGRVEMISSQVVVITTSPSSELNLGREIELVKAALLYGNAVTLMNPVAAMLARVSHLNSLSDVELFDLLATIAPYMEGADPASYRKLSRGSRRARFFGRGAGGAVRARRAANPCHTPMGRPAGR